MFWIKQIVIGDGERGLLYRNRRFQRVLPPGVYHFVDPRKRIAASVHNLAKLEYTGADIDVLMALMDGALAECFDVADIGTQQVGLVLKNGKLEDVLAPGTRKLYWKGLVPVEVQAVSLAASLELDARVATRLRQLGVLARVAVTVDVPTESAGLLFVDSTLVRTLTPGAYAFWNFGKNVSLEVIEQRAVAGGVGSGIADPRQGEPAGEPGRQPARDRSGRRAHEGGQVWRLPLPRAAVRPAQGGVRQDAGRAARRQGFA
jgi:hypothetical protein